MTNHEFRTWTSRHWKLAGTIIICAALIAATYCYFVTNNKFGRITGPGEVQVYGQVVKTGLGMCSLGKDYSWQATNYTIELILPKELAGQKLIVQKRESTSQDSMGPAGSFFSFKLDKQEFEHSVTNDEVNQFGVLKDVLRIER